MKRNSVTQKTNPKLLNAIEVSLPFLVVPNFLHFIHPHPSLSEAIGEAHLALAGKPLHTV